MNNRTIRILFVQACCNIKHSASSIDCCFGIPLCGIQRMESARREPNVRKSLSFINFAAREINCKIVYYGAGLGGKTTNLQYIFNKTADKQKSKMISLATETDRTLFFDFLPLDLGTVRGFRTRFHLYTVPGQVFYDASRKLILRGVDGVGFVAYSQEESLDSTG